MKATQDTKETAAEEAENKAKPFVVRVKIPGGKDRLIGVTEAAKWLGCSRQCLSQMAHGTNLYVTPALIERAKREFPELFERE